MSAKREMSLEVGQQPKLCRGQGRRAPARTLRASGEECAQRGDLVDESAKSWSIEQDVVDLTQQVTSGRDVPPCQVHLGELHSDAHGEEGHDERA
jgi:hypothetical protein